MQFAQRLRETADEELVTPRETFAAAAHREPDLIEELDRADEAVEAEVDEGIPSPAQQRQLRRAHTNLGRPTIGEFCRALRHVRWVRQKVCSGLIPPMLGLVPGELYVWMEDGFPFPSRISPRVRELARALHLFQSSAWDSQLQIGLRIPCSGRSFSLGRSSWTLARSCWTSLFRPQA